MRKATLLVIAVMMALMLCACGTPSSNAESKANTESVQTETSEETQPQEEQTQSPISAPTPEPIPDGVSHVNILLMGSMDRDFSEESENFSLTHLLVTLDPQEKTIKFTSFPYNLGVEVDSFDESMIVQMQDATQDGEDAAVAVLEKNFGIKIDHWVAMNMQGVIDIVDALEGIDIDVESLSLNEMAAHMIEILGLVWEEVEETGMQTLTGVQTAGYFVDTMPETEDWMLEEERLFRIHHENIINGVVAAVKVLGLSSEDLMRIAENVSGNYATSIEKDDWQMIADSAVYCLENPPQYLHIPEELTTIELENDWQAIGFDEDQDVNAVQAFVGE